MCGFFPTCRTCLDLFQSPGPTVQCELDLIASLSLLDDFHVSMLPVQVRLCENRLDIVRAVLDSTPTAYRKHSKVMLEGAYGCWYREIQSSDPSLEKNIMR